MTRVTAEALSDDDVRAYFARHCRCASPDINRTHHFDIDCDLEACEDAHVALGGRPYGVLHPRSTQTAIVQRIEARARIADVLNDGRNGGRR